MYDSKRDTIKHIWTVRRMLFKVVKALVKRGIVHDRSKLRSPEKEIFDEFTPKLKGSTYGSDEYKSFLVSMKTALDHHYMHNPHHPEFFTCDVPENNAGVVDSVLERMSLIDITEMLMDWKAATLRHDDGDIVESISLNQKRFGYSDEWKRVFLNTVKQLGLS